MTSRQDNNVAVVSGASSGIGRAIAQHLLGQGSTVYLLGRNLERLQEVAANHGHLARICQIDLSVDEELMRLRDLVQKDCGGVDLLIHCAGIILLGTLSEARVDDFDQQYRINVRSPWLLTQLLLPMLKSRSGQIVFMNSTVSLTPPRMGVGQYSASKHTLKAISDSCRMELNRDGIRVLTMFLGRTATAMQQTICEREGHHYQPERLMQPEDVVNMTMAAINLPRSAEVTEITMRPMLKTY